MRLRNTLFELAFASAFLYFISPVNSQTYDGRWDGLYSCGQHALKPDYGPFTWYQLGFSVQNGTISGRHDFTSRLGVPTTALFTGHIDRAGNITIGVVSRRQDGSEDFHQTLAGRAASAGSIELTGLMLINGERPVRNCRLTLGSVAPAESPVGQATPTPTTPAPAQNLDEERQHLKVQKKLARSMREGWRV
jgi:hypothetical protein